MKDKDLEYEQALSTKKIPILTLDNKWYKLFDNLQAYPRINGAVQKLNELLKRQGKVNTEIKDIKKLKKKLMDEIIPMAEELDQTGDKKLEKRIDKQKTLIEECNEKMEGYQDEILELPKQIEEANRELMLLTMEYCYERMQDNTEEIVEIAKWITDIRIELKKNLIRKQEMEYYNHQMYSYMHDIFGPEVINLFDMKYDPMKQHPQVGGEAEGSQGDK